VKDKKSGERDGKPYTSDAPMLLNVKEAAALCTVSESYFYKLHQKGFVPKAVCAGNVKRWRRSDLVAWVEAGCPKDWNQQTNEEGE